jgi:hypothetical protein
MMLRFQGRDGQAEPFRGFFSREPLEVTKTNDGAVVGGQIFKYPRERVRELGLRADLLRIGSRFSKYFRFSQFGVVIFRRFIHGNDDMSALPAEFGKGGIAHNSVQPGRELRLAPELVDVAERGEKTLLQRVFGVMVIMEYAIGDP